MDIVSVEEFEYLKGVASLWSQYEGHIDYNSRDIAILKYSNDLILPKFFIRQNMQMLGSDHYGDLIIQRCKAQEKVQAAHKMTKMIVEAEPRKEQEVVFSKFQEHMQNTGEFNGIIMAKPGVGKEQPYSEPVLTPDGWTTMGKLKVDDLVVSKDGAPTKILNIFEQGKKDVYNITFGDGTTTKCGLEHLWGVFNTKNEYLVLTLNEIINSKECFKIPLYKKLVTKNRKTKTIVNIEKLDYQENSRCIMVDNSDHLYITRDYTVTHNTFISIKLASLFNQKAICIVPNDILEKQWVESILEFSNLTEDDVGIIQGSDIEKLIKQGVFEKDIVVCKVQSLLSQVKRINFDLLEELYSQFGCVFYDECHSSGSAESYSKTAAVFRTNNIIGLSATPFTKGINNFLMLNSIGPVVVEIDHQNLIPNVTLHNTYIPLTKKEEGTLNWAKSDYIKFLATNYKKNF